jgi:hypothetical protein
MLLWFGMDWDVAHSNGAMFMPVRRHISFGITQQFRMLIFNYDKRTIVNSPRFDDAQLPSVRCRWIPRLDLNILNDSERHCRILLTGVCDLVAGQDDLFAQRCGPLDLDMQFIGTASAP